MSVPEFNHISESRDVINLLYLVIERIAWYVKVSLVLKMSNYKGDFADKKPYVAKYQISKMNTIIRETRKFKLFKMLKNMFAETTDPLAVELAKKLSYTSCLRGEEVKYHRIPCNSF